MGSSGSLSSTRPPVTRPGGGTKPSTESAVRLLPEPDSPTRPTSSPCPTASETPRTTGVHSPAMGNETSRSRTSRRGTRPGSRSKLALASACPALPHRSGAPAGATMATSTVVLSRELAEPVHRRRHAEAGGAGAAATVLGLDVGHAGDVEVGPALDAADELGK